MEQITTVAELKSAIQILEVEQHARERLLKEQFYITYESLKPVNIIKRTLKEMFTPSSYLNENIAGTAVGAASGFLLRKLFVGSSVNFYRRLMGKVLEAGVQKIASSKSDVISSAGISLLSKFFRRKKMISKGSDTP
jgi:hypothetical protein